MTRITLACITTGALVLAACSEPVTGPDPLDDSFPLLSEVEVSKSNDDGTGSLRAAIEAANADPSITEIELESGLRTIKLKSPLVYTGSQSLSIEGSGAVLDGTKAEFVLVANGGGNLTLEELTIQNAISHGVFVDVPGNATGTIMVRLDEVTLYGNGQYGLYVDDQTRSSDAGVYLGIYSSTIQDNGFREGLEFQDFDGVRVDEGGPGSIGFTLYRTDVLGNAADGIELDERGDGHVAFGVARSHFDGNGEQPQTDPNNPDLEDGFDIDEADDGSIIGAIVMTTANGNYDEGIDLDEEGSGDVRVSMARVEASNNNDENIKVSEDADVEGAGPADGAGGVFVTLMSVTANGSNDDGIQLEEFGAGDLRATIFGATAINNADDGIDLEQAGNGTGTALLKDVTLEPNGGDPVAADGVVVTIYP